MEFELVFFLFCRLIIGNNPIQKTRAGGGGGLFVFDRFLTATITKSDLVWHQVFSVSETFPVGKYFVTFMYWSGILRTDESGLLILRNRDTNILERLARAITTGR